MRVIDSINGGYSACGGRCNSGWYGGVLVLEDKDAAFVDCPTDASFEERASHCREWINATVPPKRMIILVTPCDDGVKQEVIAEAEYVEGPICPREQTETPVLAWIERHDARWHLMLYQDHTLCTVISCDDVIRCACVAMTDQGLIFALESDAGPFETMVRVISEKGAEVYSLAGRAPVLRATDKGYALVTEQSSPNSVHMLLQYVKDGSVAASQALMEGDYLFNGDIAWSAKDRALVVTAESSPCFGYSNQLGKYRTIHTWQWDLSSEAVPLSVLPVEQRAFLSYIAPENIPPLKPRILIDDNGMAVIFKQHRYFAMKTFGWDLFLCRREGDDWSKPARLSLELTGSDSSFGLVPIAGTCTGLFPAHESKGGPSRCSDYRVEIISFGPDHPLERYEIPEDKKGEHEVPVSYQDISPEPPELPSPYEGRQLIWGDMHIHSIYSHCVSAVDGTPEENVRYAREVLGCRVFAITEHTSWTTGPQSTWVLDRLEATAGKDNVFLYASEPGMLGMRHTNWYSRDRRTFERLERMLISQGLRYHDVLRQVREDLPPDSVFVMRHFHGQGIAEEEIPAHFDPEFEVAMEAMQGRCNAMIEAREGATEFPNQFLNAGCRIGLVGGTDHFRVCPNHFCLTGFWVKEVTADGVWEAIRSRHTIAMSDSRVAMATSSKAAPMGSDITLDEGEDLCIRLQASCARPIRRATLIRDGDVLPWTDVGATTTTLDLVDPAPTPGRHWYVPTVEVETAYEKDHFGICHGSPYFVTGR